MFAGGTDPDVVYFVVVHFVACGWGHATGIERAEGLWVFSHAAAAETSTSSLLMQQPRRTITASHGYQPGRARGRHWRPDGAGKGLAARSSWPLRQLARRFQQHRPRSSKVSAAVWLKQKKAFAITAIGSARNLRLGPADDSRPNCRWGLPIELAAASSTIATQGHQRPVRHHGQSRPVARCRAGRSSASCRPTSPFGSTSLPCKSRKKSSRSVNEMVRGRTAPP